MSNLEADKGPRGERVWAVTTSFDTGWLGQTSVPGGLREGVSWCLVDAQAAGTNCSHCLPPQSLPRCFSSARLQTLYWSHNSWIYLMSLPPIQAAGDNKRCLKENPIKYSKDYKGQERPEYTIPGASLLPFKFCPVTCNSYLFIWKLISSNARTSSKTFHVACRNPLEYNFFIYSEKATNNSKSPQFHGHKIQNVKSRFRDTSRLSPLLSL